MDVVRLVVDVEGLERLARVSEKEEIKDQTSLSYLFEGLVGAEVGAEVGEEVKAEVGAEVEAGFDEEKGFLGADFDIGG